MYRVLFISTVIATIYIRYKQVAMDGPTDLMELNKVSAVFGYLGAFFMSLVANVQIDVASIFPSL